MIRRLFLAALAAFVLVPITVHATEVVGTRHLGAAIKLRAPVEIAQLAASPAKFKGHTVRIEGTVQDVDPGLGSWLEITDGKGAMFVARPLDPAMHFPKDCKGWRVVVQGRVMPMMGTIHWEAGTTHTPDQPEWVVAAKGVDLTPTAATP